MTTWTQTSAPVTAWTPISDLDSQTIWDDGATIWDTGGGNIAGTLWDVVNDTTSWTQVSPT